MSWTQGDEVIVTTPGGDAYAWEVSSADATHVYAGGKVFLQADGTEADGGGCTLATKTIANAEAARDAAEAREAAELVTRLWCADLSASDLQAALGDLRSACDAAGVSRPAEASTTLPEWARSLL